MAYNSESHGGLYFVVGAIAVVVVVIVLMLAGGIPFFDRSAGVGGGQNVDVNVETPNTTPPAAEVPKVPAPGLGSGTTDAPPAK